MKGVGIRGVGLIPPSMGSYPGGITLSQYILTLDPILYYKMDETAGVTAINYGTLGAPANGTYNGPVLDSIDAPGGTRAPYFDGLNDYLNALTAALQGALNMTVGTIQFWYKPFAGVLTDGINRRLAIFRTNAANIFTSSKPSVNNQFITIYTANADTETYTYLNASYDWQLITLTFDDVTTDTVNYYVNDVAQAPSTPIGTWAGVLANARIGGDGVVAAQWWNGYLSHAAIWTRVLTAGEVAVIYALRAI